MVIILFIHNVEIPSIEMIEIVKLAGHEFFTNILKLLITEALSSVSSIEAEGSTSGWLLGTCYSQ